MTDHSDFQEEPKQKIELDAHGDPIRQGSLMNERQSYERIIEGLKIASDRAMHLMKMSSDIRDGDGWRRIASHLDQVRRMAVQHAGLGLVMQEHETPEVRGDPMRWRKARDEFREGLIQAAGGARQLATCHRGDITWSSVATQLETLERKIRKPKLNLVTKDGVPINRRLFH